MQTRITWWLGTIAMFGACLFASSAALAEYFVKCDGAEGAHQGPYDNGGWFIADSFGFGVEREMKESGEKGGTEDINIGVGELQELTISKSMDMASGALAQLAASGRTLGQCIIAATNGTDASGKPLCYLQYKLDRAFVKSWSTSGDADDRPTEEVAFYYNRIAFAYVAEDGARGLRVGTMSWDNVRNTPWPEGTEGLLDNLDGAPPGSDPEPEAESQ